jgi:predicted naringenin-chalcone synthase
MTLSGYVPDLIEEDFNGLVENSLQHASLQKSDISHWCIHPVGKKSFNQFKKASIYKKRSCSILIRY